MDARRGSIRVDNVSKTYHALSRPWDRLRYLLGDSRSRGSGFEALCEVTFQVEPGEAVGIIGENGAGKSTLLRAIAGTTEPTTGSVEVPGRVASILELGAGFHPEFTGRENAVMYGAMLGRGKEEISGGFGEIINFAELGDFIDKPIKTYSTGMQMRLAFAVATQVEPDVLIVDEALAVGDGYFQKKCIDRLNALKEIGTTILFCSHAMYYVTLFCTRAIWLRHGSLHRIGPAHDVVAAYESFLLRRDDRRLEPRRENPEPIATLGRRVARIASVSLNDGKRLDADRHPRTLTVAFEIETVETGERFHVGLALDAPDGRCVIAASTHLDGLDALQGSSRYRVQLVVSDLPLTAGSFTVHAYLLDESGLHLHDQLSVPQGLEVTAGRWHPALVTVPHHWLVSDG